MKSSKIEKQLKKELEQATPCDFLSIREKCGLTSPELVQIEESENGEVAISRKNVRVTAILIAAFVSLTFVVCCFWRVFFPIKPLRFEPGYFILDVNPSVEVNYDETGVVTSAQGLNDDGKSLLVGVSLEGKNYEEATKLLFERCVALGYFSAGRQDNALLTSAMNESGVKDEKMTSQLKSAFVDAFADRKIRGVVISGVTNEKLQTEAKQYGIDAQKYALILSYLALGGELSEAEYATVSIRELYAYMQTKQEKLKAERSANLALVLEKFQAELLQTLTEQIEVLVETLGVCLPLEGDVGIYDEKLQALTELAAQLENAQTQRERKKIVDKVLRGLEELKKLDDDETQISMIESAKTSVSVVYEFFEKAFLQFKRVSASPEEISAYRLKKFADYAGLMENYDFSAWQTEREPFVSENWYSLKKMWEADRECDYL